LLIHDTLLIGDFEKRIGETCSTCCTARDLGGADRVLPVTTEYHPAISILTTAYRQRLRTHAQRAIVALRRPMPIWQKLLLEDPKSNCRDSSGAVPPRRTMLPGITGTPESLQQTRFDSNNYR
jgi:hypothetical protein